MQPIVHLTLSAQVYRDLRELIISGQLQPGERLTLAGMAKALGTSAMPVREAIQKLAADDGTAAEQIGTRSGDDANQVPGTRHHPLGR